MNLMPSGMPTRRKSSLGLQSGCEQLHDSVTKGKLHLAKFILEALDNNKDVVDYQDEHGKTALIRSVKIREMRTRLKMAELLLEKGASVNIRDNMGKAVLHYACERHVNNLVKLLIKKGADPDIPDNDGCTPLIICAKVGNDIGTEMLVRCFKKLGLNIDHEDCEGLTALMTACKNGYLECSRILIHKGRASTEKRDRYHKLTAIEWAKTNGECTPQDIDEMLQKPAVEEFPTSKKLIEKPTGPNRQLSLENKRPSELYMPELEFGASSADELENEECSRPYQPLHNDDSSMTHDQPINMRRVSDESITTTSTELHPTET